MDPKGPWLAKLKTSTRAVDKVGLAQGGNQFGWRWGRLRLQNNLIEVYNRPVRVTGITRDTEKERLGKGASQGKEK